MRSARVLCAAAAAAAPRRASALDNGAVLTPPMGWSSWNKFHCGITEDLIHGIADAVASSGLLAAGYTHINLDDCWMAADRDANGSLVADSRFPAGMAELGRYLHGKGLKYGLYLDPGSKTCQRRAGTLGHEQQDADFLASVGADYLKYDACYDSSSHQLASYFLFRDALNATGRRIGYSICPDRSRCNDPKQVMWDASSVANVNMCRGDAICRDVGVHGRPAAGLLGYAASSPRARSPHDIVPTWHSWLCMLDVQAEFGSTRYAGPGHYVMPDMLEVGNGMTDAEDRAHFTMWALIAAPLVMGHDPRSQTAANLETLLNTEVIAINQDRMGKPARRVSTSGWEGVDVWVRQLWDGDYAAALFNRGNTSAVNITLDWADVGLPAEQPAQLRDVWAARDAGVHTAAYTRAVPPHSVVLLRVSQRPATPVAQQAGLAACSGAAAQVWDTGRADGTLRAAGQCLDLYNCKMDRPLNLQAYACHTGQPGCGSVNQEWDLACASAPAPIVSRVNASYCVAAAGGGLQTEPCGSAAVQRFTCRAAAGGGSLIVAADGRCLTI